MDPDLRGLLEQFVDNMLEENSLKRNLIKWKRLENELIVKSGESAMFGEIYGMAIMAYTLYKYKRRKIPIPEEDKLEFHKVMLNNARKIKDKIRFVANL